MASDEYDLNSVTAMTAAPVVSNSKFVSQREIDEARQKRQEEWEKARAADPARGNPPTQ